MVEKGTGEQPGTTGEPDARRFSDLHKGSGLVIAAEFTEGDRTSVDQAGVEHKSEVFVLMTPENPVIPASITLPGFSAPLEPVAVSYGRRRFPHHFPIGSNFLDYFPEFDGIDQK